MPFVAIAWKKVLEETYDPIIFIQVGVGLTGRTKLTVYGKAHIYLRPMGYKKIFGFLSGRVLEIAFYKLLQKMALKNL